MLEWENCVRRWEEAYSRVRNLETWEETPGLVVAAVSALVVVMMLCCYVAVYLIKLKTKQIPRCTVSLCSDSKMKDLCQS